MQAVYYRATDGSEPVNDFIDRLDMKRQVALDNQIERLNMLTPDLPHLPYPHSSQVEGELRELRCHFGRELYRILYRRSPWLCRRRPCGAPQPVDYAAPDSPDPRQELSCAAWH